MRRGGRLGRGFPACPAAVASSAIAVAVTVLAAAAAGIAVGVAHGGQAGPGSTTGPARQARPAAEPARPGAAGPRLWRKHRSARRTGQPIRATGRTATVLTLPGTGTGSLVADAALLNSAVNNALAHGAPSVDVIGYSAGGVVALIWARRDDGFDRARRVITLGSPFHGTSLAAAAQAFVPDACPVACQQLIPGSSLLDSLDVASAAGLPHWLSLWTTDDQVVMPPDSARLAGAIDVPVQSVCPAVSISHSQLPTNPDVTAIVLQALSAAPLRTPTSADCR